MLEGGGFALFGPALQDLLGSLGHRHWSRRTVGGRMHAMTGQPIHASITRFPMEPSKFAGVNFHRG